jgi:hypothetical protein
MFLSEVSADGVADLQLTAASFPLYPGSGLLTNQWLADKRRRRPQRSNSVRIKSLWQKTHFDTGNRIVETERYRP